MAESNQLVIRVNADVKQYQDSLKKINKKTENLQQELASVARKSAIAFTALAGVITLTANDFAQYEKALVGVGKTTDIEGEKLQKFGKEFQKMSTQIPVATNELLAISQAAGQLGVRGEKNLLKFSETVAKLGVATDLSGEQAAISLTRILNVTGEGIETIDNFGSVIVELGNNFAATESEIVRMATEVSRSTAVFGVSAAESAALGTALKSVGVQAQLGGSAIGRAFRSIDKSVRSGGESFEDLQRVTGMTGDQLKKTFKEDSTAVFQSFIEGIGKIQKAGGDTTAELEKFELQGDEILKVLPVLAKNSELVGSALRSAADETENATALNEEAAKAFDTLGSEAQLLNNNFKNLRVNIGERLAPAIIDLLKGTSEIIKNISELDDETIETIATFLKWGTAIAGLTAGAAAFALAAIKVSALIGAISAAFIPATIAASSFWVALTGPIGIAVAGIAAITAGVIGLYNALEKEEPKTLEQVNRELKDINKEIDEIDSKDHKTGRDIYGVDRLKAERKELEKLRQEALRARDDFGTGEMLIRPKADRSGPNLGASAFGLEEQTLPFRPDEENQEKEIEEIKEHEENKRNLKLEEFNRTKQALLDAKGLETEEELEQLEEERERKKELDQIAKAEKLEREGEHDQALMMLEELKNDKIIEETKKMVEEKEKAAKREKKIDEMNIQATQNFIQAGAMLAKDGSETQKNLQAVNALISTYSAANQALATPPGPPFTIPLAASVAALGLANVAKIKGAEFADGGMFMGGIPGVDSIPAVVQQREIIAPTRSFDEVVEGTARQRGFTREDDEGAGGGTLRIELVPTGDFVDVLEQRIIERRINNTGLGV